MRPSLSSFFSATFLVSSIASLALLPSCGGGGGEITASGGGGGGGGTVVQNLAEVSGFGQGGGSADVPVSGVPSAPPPAAVPPLGNDTGGQTPGGGGGGSTGGGDNTIPVATTSVSASTLGTFSGTTDESAFSVVELTTAADVTSFQIVTTVTALNLGSIFLASPTGQFLWSTADVQPHTSAVFSAPEVNAAPYPALGSDPAVIAGKYNVLIKTVALNTANAAVGGAPFTGKVIAKHDSNLSGGTLRVNFFLVGATAQNSATRAALNSAITLWRNIYAQVGITLDVDGPFDVPSADETIPRPDQGGALYQLTPAAVGANGDGALNIYFANDIAGDFGTSLDLLLGASPSIPGAALLTTHSAIAISVANHGGVDGAITTPDEVVQLAETLAHEAGHYLGLFHPVELDASRSGTCDQLGPFVEGDPLSDTASCTEGITCQATQVTSNLMFPCANEDLGSQQILTAQQRQVMNLQVLVN